MKRDYTVIIERRYELPYTVSAPNRPEAERRAIAIDDRAPYSPHARRVLSVSRVPRSASPDPLKGETDERG